MQHTHLCCIHNQQYLTLQLLHKHVSTQTKCPLQHKSAHTLPILPYTACIYLVHTVHTIHQTLYTTQCIILRPILYTIHQYHVNYANQHVTTHSWRRAPVRLHHSIRRSHLKSRTSTDPSLLPYHSLHITRSILQLTITQPTSPSFTTSTFHFHYITPYAHAMHPGS